MPEELEKQGLLDRQLWYMVWGLWSNIVSLIRWEFLGYVQEIRETRCVGYADLVYDMEFVG